MPGMYTLLCVRNSLKSTQVLSHTFPTPEERVWHILIQVEKIRYYWYSYMRGDLQVIWTGIN